AEEEKYIPYSQWTPIVQGLNTDASDSGSPPQILGVRSQWKLRRKEKRGIRRRRVVDPLMATRMPRMPPLMNSKSIMRKQFSNSSKFGSASFTGNSRVYRIVKSSRFSSLSPQEIHRVNPNSSNSYMDVNPLIDSTSNGRDLGLNSNLIPDVDLNDKMSMRTCERGGEPSTSNSIIKFMLMGNKIPNPLAILKGSVNNLFADNRKPIGDFLSKKVEFNPSEGYLDFSDESLVA
ncbi:hypothetical protein Dimus_004225, partial [Dionaea muscipula]